MTNKDLCLQTTLTFIALIPFVLYNEFLIFWFTTELFSLYLGQGYWYMHSILLNMFSYTSPMIKIIHVCVPVFFTKNHDGQCTVHYEIFSEKMGEVHKGFRIHVQHLGPVS